MRVPKISKSQSRQLVGFDGEFVESSKFGIIAQPSTGGNTTAGATGVNQTGNATTVSPAG